MLSVPSAIRPCVTNLCALAELIWAVRADTGMIFLRGRKYTSVRFTDERTTVLTLEHWAPFDWTVIEVLVVALVCLATIRLPCDHSLPAVGLNHAQSPRASA